MSEKLADDYGLAENVATRKIAAPQLDYRPHDPKSYRPQIGLIGCGGISTHHLNAYKHAGYTVVALCDKDIERARKQQGEFYPKAKIYDDYRALLDQRGIDVVDIATHPKERVNIIEAALLAGKHVLSQKPFVLDLDVGEKLVELAEEQGVKLAVNQNARWSPHFSYIRQAIRAGLIGELTSVHFNIHWDHTWIIGTPFEEIHHLLLYDFAIHWFDLTVNFFGARTPKQVYATATRATGQKARPPMLAQSLIDFDGGHASLILDANIKYGQEDRTYVSGTEGVIKSVGPSLSEQSVTLYTREGYAIPELEGTWFREGFHGAMGELLCAIEEGREPFNNARENLRSLELAFAAIASADDRAPKRPGQIRELPVK